MSTSTPVPKRIPSIVNSMPAPLRQVAIFFFRDGEYNPNSSGGRELLAHELTHVVQQGGSQAMKKPDEESSK